jgi:hypothetical protein
VRRARAEKSKIRPNLELKVYIKNIAKSAQNTARREEKFFNHCQGSVATSFATALGWLAG